ncbi:hypothetical protein SEA_JENOS_58 [Microbacterium phage Jenos]|uniref:Uncharacterized protein n=1 Tax=Microbacterium phage McGalleon TaxID=2590936 RepID=A0A516KQZ0_9CAUD|nr:hypothetical protein H3N88_gp57 [Microbacterium phage McGalleon]QDP44108.1 hypothetical protein SEA_MCGALLEON_57 [Microbacterium phage McGalleon]QXO14527.1 hypothetical protein SEA_JENOS_58 [Microbacterium phage Jenos]
MSWVQRELTVAQASSLWTFGRATPMDGDRLAYDRYMARLNDGFLKYIENWFADFWKVRNNLLMNNTADTFETLLARMAELTSIPLDAREQFDAMLRANFEGEINDDASDTEHPTAEQVRKYLMDDNGWTEEEWHQFSGYYFREINADGTTGLTFDAWTRLASDF